jgi:hypothetical protein
METQGPGALQGHPVQIIAPSTARPPMRPEGIDDVNRHKHDGTQPTHEKATPSHKAGVAWPVRH